ncbi:restriction endonuclease subunit S [Aliiroseovarius crassostreae]|uniref:restriction endonuclease subunit S n=1 Tax=Aliiroseovarius crassostreae TaxID=154981 RepID=UPI0021B079AA|nr:restriction endonuclease subunit S [Aliiroseovarius crassostreae]UWP90197.1 restriction endonuclease subunit S [Aliiroseovarius crassostreae]
MKALRFKQFLRERNQFSRTGEETLLSVSEYYGVKPRREAFQHEEHESRAASLEGYRIVQKNDLVMNYMLAWKGAYGVSDHDGIVSPAYSVFEVDHRVADVRYLHHRVRSDDMKAYFRSRSKGIIESRLRLYPDSLLASHVKLPDLDTQRQIADFLDRETARIDLLIEKKRRFIEALVQKWAATVTFTLTNGLNPEAPKKDVGVSWIGKVPEHWSVAKLGHIGRCANGINIGGDAFGSGFPFVSYGDAYKNPELPHSVNGLVQSSAEDRARYDLKEGDVLFTRTSETIEEIGFSSVCMEDMPNAVFAGFLIRFRPTKGKLHPLFSKFLFRNERLRAFFSKEMMIVTRASLSQGLLQRMPVVLPPIEEQHEIAQHLQKLENTFLSVAEKTKESIERLKEYRSALITAAVTGQIDVTNHSISSAAEHSLDALQEEVSA